MNSNLKTATELEVQRASIHEIEEYLTDLARAISSLEEAWGVIDGSVVSPSEAFPPVNDRLTEIMRNIIASIERVVRVDQSIRSRL